MDNVLTIQAYLSNEKCLHYCDSSVPSLPAVDNLLNLSNCDDLDKSRPVRVVIIPASVFLNSAAPFEFLAKAQQPFFEGQELFGSYQPTVYISSNQWNDTSHSSITELRAYRVTDSSIWNFHLYLTNVEKGEYEQDRKSWVLESLYNNYNRGLYNLHACCEYANLNARLVQQSYLEGGHAHICPFIFHSEFGMRKTLIEKEIDALRRCENHQWRILLVDDKSVSPMKSTNDSVSVNKLDIIIPLIQELFPKKKIITLKYDSNDTVPFDTFLLLHYAESLEQAEKALATRKYDIILLDYLLSGEDNAQTEYGYMLLKGLENGVLNVLPGPGRTQFFLFISAYVTAVNERLSAEMISRNKKDCWHISEGACPTNTPNHFKLLLLRLMDKRLLDMGIDKLSGRSVANDLIWRVYRSDRKDDVRKRANDYYQDVLDLLYHYKRLLEDVEIPESGSLFQTRGSVLITSVCQRLPQFDGFLEHLTNLMHLTAFGTVRQWPEMWEEYIYLKTQLRDFYEPQENDVTFKDLCDSIEQYIVELRGAEK